MEWETYLWMWDSIAGEEKVGRWDWSEKISSWVIMLIRGWSRFNQYGICPLVTIKIFLTHGAYLSIDLRE